GGGVTPVDGVTAGVSMARYSPRSARSCTRSGAGDEGRLASFCADGMSALEFAAGLSRSAATVLPTITATTAAPASSGRDLRDGRGRRSSACLPDNGLTLRRRPNRGTVSTPQRDLSISPGTYAYFVL